MSGHSKWAQIKRQKGVADIKKGQTFTKLANAITIAVHQSGGITDPDSNFRLRLAMEKARQANMPKSNIERAIQRAVSKEEGGIEEVVYEGYGPGGVAVITEAVTDNRQRTTSDIRNIFEKNGGSLGEKGSVTYLFESVGILTIGKNDKATDEIMLLAIDAGAQDVEEVEGMVEIYTKPEDLNKVKENLQREGLKIEATEVIQRPKTTVFISDSETAQKILSFLEKLEALDDVQKVYANFDIPDNFLEKMQDS